MNSTKQNLYPWAFGASFLILTALIGFLIFNTYQLEDKNYQIQQLQQIQQAYGNKVMEDKIFPGGDAVFQSALEPCLTIWQDKVMQHSNDAPNYGNKCMTSFLDRMREQQSLDTIFEEIVRQQQLDSTLIYLFHFDKLEVYNSLDHSWGIFYESDGDNPIGVLSGTLQKTTSNNRVFQISVSEKDPISYRFTYSLYVDYENRIWRILQQMAPVFLLSLACIVVIVLLSYNTYKNWINQRKLADLKTSFLNHMRHEFNTPLTTILISAHSLLDRDTQQDPIEVASLAQIVERQAKRLKNYFGQVMGSVTLQEQQPKIVSVPIDLLTMQIIEELRLRYQQEIQIEYQPLGSDVKLNLDEDYYFSILDNMISNAIKFNDRADKSIQFAWERKQDQSCLVITDNGRGIPLEDQKNIFTAFYRAPTSGSTPGLGLGLFYVKSCLDRLGWTIRVENRSTGGIRFTIYIGNESFSSK